MAGSTHIQLVFPETGFEIEVESDCSLKAALQAGFKDYWSAGFSPPEGYRVENQLALGFAPLTPTYGLRM
ncbi:MAG: hypothetical protein WCA08_15645 [Desulfoferrobacter sp.]